MVLESELKPVAHRRISLSEEPRADKVNLPPLVPISKRSGSVESISQASEVVENRKARQGSDQRSPRVPYRDTKQLAKIGTFTLPDFTKK